MTITLEIPDELSGEIERAAQKRGVDTRRFILEAVEWVLSHEEHDLFDTLAHQRSLRDVPELPPITDG